MALTYEQADTLGLGWELRVRHGIRVVGRIRPSRDGRYQFYEGTGGTGVSLLERPILEHDSLEALKVAIEGRSV